ncbi:ABC transporter permease subunit [Acidovorax sp. SUPP2522]|uniref:ABC transporter permease subunit n=1 Tax=Acidovorax sp. SUPP2522 TaxID=511900 RepID=UPI00234942F4|nr:MULTISPECIES: ABC transporter permease subunit [unclassified Acidovorax]WCN00526.1 ABC transporter permease subunit [Acidovorax sp. GBBC 1281]GKT13483.1 ABC transporter permease subunit [Acidovorax sp. SUPP2522]
MGQQVAPQDAALRPPVPEEPDPATVRPVSPFLRPGAGSSRALSALCVVALLALWWAATHWRWVPPLFLPAPSAVARAFFDAWHGRIQGGEPLWVHLQWSALRVFGAFALAAVTAVPVGIAMGVSRIARGVFDPPIEFYRPLPPLAYLPLIVIWLGIDEASKVLLIYLACFAPIALAAKAGVRSASTEQLNAAASLGASRLQVVWHVVVPAALPEILVGLRIALGFGWTTLVAAEMVAATVGVGQMVLNASNFLRTDLVVMGILVIGLVAWSFDLAVRWAEARLVPWKGGRA